MEVEQVVRAQRRPDAGLGQLRGQAPHLHAHTARHEQVDDPARRVLRHRTRARRALKAVRTPLIVGRTQPVSKYGATNATLIALATFTNTAGAANATASE